MVKILDFLKEYKAYIIIGLTIFLVVALQTSLIFYLNSKNESETIEIKDLQKEEKEEEKKKDEKYFYVDIRGEVRKKGVYKLLEGKRVIDAIKMAGGLTSKADTSANNLSLKLKDEMVIIIYSKNQIKNFATIKKEENQINDSCHIEKYDVLNNSCIDSETSNKKNDKVISKSDKVSLNKATKEELIGLSGIGEAKALKIIEYRNISPFQTIEDLKKVSGIGDTLYEQVKDYITI